MVTTTATETHGAGVCQICAVAHAVSNDCDGMTDDENEAAEFAAYTERAERERATVLTALGAGVRWFKHRACVGWFATVAPSARPDCPPGAWQVTWWDADGPVGHVYGAPWDGVTACLCGDGYTVPA